MKLKARSLDEWHEIHTVLKACEFHREVFVRQQQELERLLPELDSDTVVDVSNGLVLLEELEVKSNEVA